ncbi:MAG TPA: hypothetical protein VHO93_13500 [Actinomycetota bacterium]|jgi:hypothetical protein|nr:hypothetical protein [Actinomycetota bacterium]
MKQQAELALADLPVAPPHLRVVAPWAAAATAPAVAAPLQLATIRTLFPAVHHVHADRSALRRALALWAATKRAAELGRRQTASRLWSRRWNRRAAHPWSPTAALTGSEAIIPVDRFIASLEEAERAFPGDSPADLLSRIRNTYYSGFLVSQLLPDARAHGSRTLHGNTLLGRTAHRHLTARADENGVGDNPAPYVLLPSGEQIDIGHLFLGLEALLHPRTTVPFSAYGVPNIDATGWVADVGMASVWTTKHAEGAPDPRVSRRLPGPDRDAYYLMSAPDADLLGDIDVFAMCAQWALAAGQPLSAALRAYYLGRPGRPPGLRWRWRAFASVNRLAFGRDGGRVAWDPAWWSGWVRRIDRFNDVYGAGVGGSLWGTITRPASRAWPETPYMLGLFLTWAQPLLEAELATWS